MSVTVVLDTTAVLAYTEGSIAVGELLSIVTDDADTALIPGTCLAEAYRRLCDGKDSLASLLSTIPAFRSDRLSADRPPRSASRHARPATSVASTLATRATEALTREAQLATRNVAVMRRLLPTDWPIIEV